MRLTAVKIGKIRRYINALDGNCVAKWREGKLDTSGLDYAVLTAVKTDENKRRINPLTSIGGW